MRVDRCVTCRTFPCRDVRHECFVVPGIDVRPGDVSIVMISEAAPADPRDYYDAKGDPLFARTTIQAFNDAGAAVTSMKELRRLGVYLTTAVKCGKTGYGVTVATIDECSRLLEHELALFPHARVIMLMGDVAIRALNAIAKRAGEKRVIPAGSTYKIRGQQYTFQGKRVFPSYLQAGPSFFIEASKRRMIAEDLAAALRLAT
jgi:uracil-DNA glycosylase